MLRLLKRAFTIKTRWEAWAVTYAIAVGAADRGLHYVAQFPGWVGWMFFAACVTVVFMVGGRLLDMTRKDAGQRRRKSDFVASAT